MIANAPMDTPIQIGPGGERRLRRREDTLAAENLG